MPLLQTVQDRLIQALEKCGYPEAAKLPVATAVDYISVTNPKIPVTADIACKGLLGAAKQIKMNPKELATKVHENLQISDIGTATVDGPGFVNITLNNSFLDAKLKSIYDDKEDRFGVEVDNTKKIVIDYSSPNLAKEMHVGHLRSTIIGDSISRIHEFAGAELIRQNHVGDWGTPFCMLIAHVEDTKDVDLTQLKGLEELYVAAKKRFDSEPDFAERARQLVSKLQGGDEEILAKWHQILEVSLRHGEELYKILDIKLKRSDVKGESSYNDDLNNVVADLTNEGLVVENEGAKVVLTPKFQSSFKGDPVFMVQKEDGGFGYPATDLAAIRYRVKLNPTSILYVVDQRQSLHFNQLFDVATRAHFLPENIKAEHVQFGMMLGKDRKPFKTRSGGTVKLIDLIIEAEERALESAKEKNEKREDSQKFNEEELKSIAKAVGVGAVKYADLSKHRIKDYIFDMDGMLQFEGNTAPYLMYAYTRCKSVVRQATKEELILDSYKIGEQAEHELAVAILQFPEVIAEVLKTNCPHHLCTYLYKVATLYSKFYEHCPILKSEGDTKKSRLALCELTSRLIKKSLSLLGIGVLEAM